MSANVFYITPSPFQKEMLMTVTLHRCYSFVISIALRCVQTRPYEYQSSVQHLLYLSSACLNELMCAHHFPALIG